MEIGPIFRALKRNQARTVLVVLEVALTLAIVVNCLSLVMDARGEMAKRSGFDEDNMLRVRSSAFAPEFADEQYALDAGDADRAALAAMPGVRSVSETYFLPWQGGGSSFEVKIAGTEMEKVRSQVYGTDPQILDTLGVELVAGRSFTAEDYAIDPDAAVRPVMVSRGLADLLFPDGGARAAVGKGLDAGSEDQTYSIVGVFDPFYNPYGWPIHEYAVFTARRQAGSDGAAFLVRTRPGQLAAVAADLERTLLAVNDGRNLEIFTVPEIKDRFFTDRRVMVGLLDVVMVLLVFVTGLGIVGLTSFSVAERQRQIGTRRALGATRGDILRYFLLENWLVTTIGVVLGVGAAFALNVAIVNLVPAARLGPELVAAAIGALWGLGLAATLGPALRGARIAPAVATRTV